MLDVKDISKSIKGRKIVSKVNIEINKSDIFGLLGPNGAGKTSTFYIIAGLMNPDDGKIILSNKDISKLPMHKRSKLGIKYLPQEPSIFQNLTVYENLLGLAELSFKNNKDITDFVSSSIEEFGLSDITQLKGRQLSGGQRRKVEIARTLAAKPKIILLDEPFAGIDPLAIEDIKSVLKSLSAKGISILITDHNLRETMDVCNYSIVIKNGSILDKGEKDYLVNSSLIKKEYFGKVFD